MAALHPDDLRTLNFTFAADDYAEDREHKIADALGIDVNAVRGLAGAMIADLRWVDPATYGDGDRAEVSADAFGLSWWKDYEALGFARRLMIGDYLIETVDSIETNLLEARLHLSAARASLSAASHSEAHGIEGLQGHERPLRIGASQSSYDSTSPIEYLHGTMAQLHIGAMLRAVGSTVDCMAAVMIGVLGLPLNIKKADYGRVKRWMREHVPRLPVSDGLAFQTESVNAVFATFESRTPQGWLEWVTDYRNTFIHRGRRHQHWDEPVGLRLPSQPDRSEIESRIASFFPECLYEPCEVTLEGVMHNVQAGTFDACTLLLAAWQRRREAPALVAQPVAQWPDPPPVDAGTSFPGFAPREISAADVAITSPTNAKRCCAAAVDRRLKHLWRESR